MRERNMVKENLLGTMVVNMMVNSMRIMPFNINNLEIIDGLMELCTMVVG